MLKSKLPVSTACDYMMNVVERLDNESRLKLGADLAVFIGLCLVADKKNLSLRAGHICTSVGGKINEVVKILLVKDNVDVLLEQPDLLA